MLSNCCCPLLALYVQLQVAGTWNSRRIIFALFPTLHCSLCSVSTCFLEPLLQLAGNPIYAVRVMAAKALVPVVPTAGYRSILLRLAGDLAEQGGVLSHNTLHGRLLQIRALLAYAADTNWCVGFWVIPLHSLCFHGRRARPQIPTPKAGAQRKQPGRECLDKY